MLFQHRTSAIRVEALTMSRTHSAIASITLAAAAALIACLSASPAAPSVTTGPTTPREAKALADPIQNDASEAAPAFPALWRVIPGVGDPSVRAREDRARTNLITQCMRTFGLPYLDEDTLDTNPEWLAMSSTARDAYKLALYGTSTPENARSEPGGCSSSAYARIPGSANIGSALAGAWFDAQRSLEKSPAVVEAVKTWSACMATGGFAYASDKGISMAADAAHLQGSDGSGRVTAAIAYSETNCAEPLRHVRRQVSADIEATFAAGHRKEIADIIARNKAMTMVVDANQ